MLIYFPQIVFSFNIWYYKILRSKWEETLEYGKGEEMEVILIE